MKTTTDQDFVDFCDSIRPEQDVHTPIMVDGHCEDYIIGIPEYLESLGELPCDIDDCNGGEILAITGNKDNVSVVYNLAFFNMNTNDSLEVVYIATGKLVKNDEDQIIFNVDKVIEGKMK